MKIIKLAIEIIIGFSVITAVFAALNAWGILGWQAMETVWLFYPGFIALVSAYAFSKSFSRPGSGIFFAFCLIVPAILISSHFELPWGDFFFNPTVIIIAGLFSIIGEGFNGISNKTIVTDHNQERNQKV